eukprot:CAMPEP_0194297034 /NCGR_PEP_ID=MMETSP0169-20130528/57789_1 /TAXON_ID=218684 /ORGANISM="Corethron pennatum, Strain L29A3" /LENGTH=77 /DNA_ID=CAMNT_0039046711 /DNA_START=208 /DNA_END=441 /DNA_ORIENTATION=+
MASPANAAVEETRAIRSASESGPVSESRAKTAATAKKEKNMHRAMVSCSAGEKNRAVCTRRERHNIDAAQDRQTTVS